MGGEQKLVWHFQPSDLSGNAVSKLAGILQCTERAVVEETKEAMQGVVDPDSQAAQEGHLDIATRS